METTPILPTYFHVVVVNGSVYYQFLYKTRGFRNKRKNLVFWNFKLDSPLGKISKNFQKIVVLKMHILAKKKCSVPLLDWEQWQFQVFFCNFLAPWGAENFEKISAHKPMFIIYILGGKKNFLASPIKAEFLPKNTFLRNSDEWGGDGENFFGPKTFIEVYSLQ